MKKKITHKQYFILLKRDEHVQDSNPKKMNVGVTH